MALQKLVMTVLMIGVLLATWTLTTSDRHEQLCDHGARQASAAADLLGAASGRASLDGC